jgi:hypothetical protein
MATDFRLKTDFNTDSCSQLWRRLLSMSGFILLLLALIPIASAHEGTETMGITRWHGIGILLLGVLVVTIAVIAKRTERTTPTTALSGILFGLAIAIFGAVLFEGLSPDPSYAVSSMPFPRFWYKPLSLGLGLGIAVISFVVGWLRWTTRPRYTFFGILMGLWVAYPELITGQGSDTHPLGYAIVLVTPIFVGYILWKDAWPVLRTVLVDSVARRFGIGVGVLTGLFFASVSGYISFLPEEGFPQEVTVVVLPSNYQLVRWSTLEVAIPQIPFFIALSMGLVLIVGLLSVLVGLNAAMIARQWRLEQRAGMVEGTAGTGAIVGSCTCGCCGPLVAKIAILAAGPSIAAPLYWIFVDTASPLSPLFIIVSIVLFTGSLVYSVENARIPGQRTSISEPTDI